MSSIVTPEHLGTIAIGARKKPDGTPLVLSDVADVKEGTWPLFGEAVVNDGPGLMLVVEKFPDADTVEVTGNVEKAMAACKAEAEKNKWNVAIAIVGAVALAKKKL